MIDLLFMYLIFFRIILCTHKLCECPILSLLNFSYHLNSWIILVQFLFLFKWISGPTFVIVFICSNFGYCFDAIVSVTVVQFWSNAKRTTCKFCTQINKENLCKISSLLVWQLHKRKKPLQNIKNNFIDIKTTDAAS